MDKTLFGYARHFLSGTILSRITGLFRDVCMAFAFGDIPEVAALILAYRLCMLLRRVLGEGSMQSAFIPGYQTIKEKDPSLALEFFKQVVFKWLIGVTGLCLVLGLGLFYLKPFFPMNWTSVIDLSIRLLPCLVFIIGYTLFQAFLQCHGRYFTASLAPVFSNLLWGIGCIYSRDLPSVQAMQTVSTFICLGLFMQWLCLLPETKKVAQIKLSQFKPAKISKDIYGFNFFNAVALAAIGVSATQINSALDGIFAKFADPKGPIHLWFSIRIQQLPLALLSIGLISAASPKLCQLLANNQKNEAQDLCRSVATKLSILMMFLTCAIILIGDKIIHLLFTHGMFSEAASQETLRCLVAYMIGLVPTSLATVYASFFYALKEYKKPSIASVTCLIMNLVLNALMVFVFNFGSWSVAAATSACSFLNAYLLKRSLSSEDLLLNASMKEMIYPYLIAIASSGVVFLSKGLYSGLPTLASILILFTSYSVLYLSLCKLVKYQEPLNLFSSILPQRLQRSL
jgi:putative peptidoglycan lipid II flippase